LEIGDKKRTDNVRVTMAVVEIVETKERFTGKLGHGCDLLGELSEICREKNVRLGWLKGLGAVRKACQAYYDQHTHEYQPLEIDRPLEITHLVGNVSVKDGNPFVHAHVTLADEEGHAYGGHLAPGTIVFACEFTLEALSGGALERPFDETTGLSLWKMSE
jgi:uncharacterized protein